MAVTTINGGTQIRDATITPAKVTSGIIVAAGTNAFSADQSHGGFKITNVGAPVSGGDAATKTYVDNAVVGLLDFKGSTDCSANPNYPVGVKGDAYYVSVAGKIGGASGKVVSVGDVYVANADNAGGNEATVGTSWFVMEGNIAGISANGLSLITAADYSAMRTLLSLVPGTNVQAFDAELAAIAGLTSAADKGIMFTGSGTAAVYALTAAALTVLDDTTVGAMLDTLGGATHTGTGGVVCAVSPTFTGTPTGPTAAPGTNTTQFATTAYVTAAIAALPGGSTMVNRETPAGTVNGSNVMFTLAFTPISGTEMVFINGILQDAGAGNDYTISGAVITTLSGSTPVTGDKIRVTYWK